MKLAALYSVGEAIESAALSFVVRVGPWLGPVPTAYLVYERTQRHLDWPTWVAIAAGITLECLGVGTSAVALKFWTYNSTKLAKEPEAPTKIPVTLTGVYFVAALFLTVVLDVLTVDRKLRASDFAPAAFPLLSLSAVALLALRFAHTGAFMSKAARKALRVAEKDLYAAQSEPQPAPEPEPITPELQQPAATRDDWRALYAQTNGEYAQVNGEGVRVALEAEGFTVTRAPRTLDLWAAEAREKSE